MLHKFNEKSLQMINKIKCFCLVFGLLIMVAACDRVPATGDKPQTPIPTQIIQPEYTIPSSSDASALTLTPPSTPTPTPGPSPTPRVFEPPPSCGGWDENGHILYINDSYWPELNPASQYDLYIMNGNGCYPRLMLTGVSGSPA